MERIFHGHAYGWMDECDRYFSFERLLMVRNWLASYLLTGFGSFGYNHNFSSPWSVGVLFGSSKAIFTRSSS